MTLDIRANIICNLGPVISGGFSDDHVQGTGLIRTRGELVLNGLFTCRPGDEVKLAYKKGTRTNRIPRRLRVLSSFADPFRRQTTVSIGCKLTMMENLRENKQNNPAEDPANSGIPCSEYEKTPINISFGFIFNTCLDALALECDEPPTLPGSLAIGSFDYSSGYVSILSDILQSHSKIGYLNANEKLVVASLTALPETTAVFEEDDLIDVAPIRSGDLPADTVIVNYSYNRFKQPDEEDDDDLETRNWERDEHQGELETVYIEYDDGDGLYTASYYPYSVTTTSYDKLDRVTTRTEMSRAHVARHNSSYYRDLLNEFGQISATNDGMVETTTVTEMIYKYSADQLAKPPDNLSPCAYWFSAMRKEYDEERDSQPIGHVETRYESYMGLAGSINFPEYVFVDGSVLHPGTETFPAEIKSVSFESNQEAGITKTKTIRQLAYAYTQQGQQGFAKMLEDAENAGEALSLLMYGSSLVTTGVDIQTHYDRNYGVQKRPGTTERTKEKYYKDPRESVSRLAFVQGAQGTGITTSYSLPYAPDDKIGITFGANSTTYLVEASNAQGMALTFGRVQQKLAYGHRMGFSAQLVPNKLPRFAAETVSLHLGGIMAKYLVNGQSWSFDSNGIVANVDLLYLGGVGTTNQAYSVPAPWSPVQSGITALPNAPAITTNANPQPANSILTPENFDPNDPPSTFWDDLPTDTPPVYEKEAVVPTVIPPYIEEIFYTFALKPRIEATRTLISIPQERIVSLVTRLINRTGTLMERSPLALVTRLRSAVTSFVPFDFALGDAVPLAGSGITTSTPSGWTQIFNGNNDDTPVASGTFAFSFPYNGTNYTSCFISPNAYITFGSGSSVYNVSATSPALNKIFINATDDSFQRAYTKSTANTFRIRYEGNTNSSGTGTDYRVFEIAFFNPAVFEGYPLIEVRMGLSSVNTGLFNVYSASAVLSTGTATPAANKSWVFGADNVTGTSWSIIPAFSVIPVE